MVRSRAAQLISSFRCITKKPHALRNTCHQRGRTGNTHCQTQSFSSAECLFQEQHAQQSVELTDISSHSYLAIPTSCWTDDETPLLSSAGNAVKTLTDCCIGLKRLLCNERASIESAVTCMISFCNLFNAFTGLAYAAYRT